MDILFNTEIIIRAYAEGFFPMADDEDGEIYWHSPDPRAVFPLNSIAPSRKLVKEFLKQNFRFTIDRHFTEVIQHCSNRSLTWINEDIKYAYIELFENGFAHSIEVYQENELAGGLYGVALKGAFFGESMFNFVSNAAKAAFYFLVDHLKKKGYVLLDSQYLNPFTEQLGAVEIPKHDYMKLLDEALKIECSFNP